MENISQNICLLHSGHDFTPRIYLKKTLLRKRISVWINWLKISGTGLQLFIAKDGTTALGSQDVVKSQMSKSGAFKQVVIEDNR